MKLRYIKYVTVLGLMAILSLQTIWLYNTYRLVKDDIREKLLQKVQNSIELEQTYRMNILFETKIVTQLEGGPAEKEGKLINQNLYFQEALLKYGIPISLFRLDSILRSNLEDINITSNLVLNLINIKNNSVLQSTDSLKKGGWGAIKTDIIPIRLDGSEGIQAVLLNPYQAVFERLGLLLVATVLIMLFVAVCIVYQIKIILLQNKIAKLKEDFSYAMIHDMKTPLSSILMGTRILQSGKLDDKPEKKQKHFRIVEEETTHLLTLTEKILAISKLESGKLELNKQPFPIAPVIDDLIEKYTVKAGKPVEFVTDIQEETIYADEDYIKEAISNLIDNAIKYSGVSVRIEITVCSKDTETLIKVKDNGFGISHADQKKIFEKFERASAIKRTRNGGATGFGLGLNYVFRVIAAHGGRVWVESIEDEYSEFTIYLPA